MRLDCQLRAFNAEVTASPRIAPPPCLHNCPTVLVLLFVTTGRAIFGGVLLSPSVTLVGRGQDGSRQRIPTAWAFLTHPRTFLLSLRGFWALYEMGRACQILRPHNSPLKSCCPAPRTEMRVLMSSGPSNGLSSLILCLASGPFCLPKTHFWRFSIQSKSSLNSGGSVLPTLDGVMVIQQ